MPFRVEHDHLVIDAELNRQPSHLVFDTGAQTSVLTDAAVRRFGLRTETERAGTMTGIGGTRLTSLVDTESFGIRNLQGRDFHFLAGQIFGDTGHEPDGVLSTDFLSHYDIDLDVPARRIDFFQSSGDCSHPSAALNGDLSSVPLVDADDPDTRPRIEVSIEGKPFTALLDTGARSSVLFRSAASRLGLRVAELKADRVGKIGGIGPNPVVAYRHVLQTVTIGDIVIQNMPIAIADQAEIGDDAMILGLNFIGRVHLWISYSSGHLIIQYPPRRSPLDQHAS